LRSGTQTKEKIEKTALRLFVEKGVTETTVRDIAAGAEIAEGTLYRHYASKDELAWSLFLSGFTELCAALDGMRRQHEGVKAQIEGMIRLACGLFDRNPTLFSYLLIAQHTQLRRIIPDHPSPLLVLRDTIKDGMARGEIPEGDPMVKAAMVLGIVEQAAAAKVYGRIDCSLTSLADTLVAASCSVLEVARSLSE
jgi:AcrR family transcriptional regulator